MTLLLVAWGAFAFGSVYPWAYRPLAAGCAITGILGLARGDRPVIGASLWFWIALAAIALVTIIQLMPLPRVALESVSPGTVNFLANYDFQFAMPVDDGLGGLVDVRHAVSIAPQDTVVALWLLAAFALFLAGLLRNLSRTATRRLAVGIVFIGCVLALVGIVQKALLGDVVYNGMKIYGFWTPEQLLASPFGPYVNKNHFGGWMLMAIPLAFGLGKASVERDQGVVGRGFSQTIVWLSSPAGGRLSMSASAMLLMSASLLMTRSRSAMACFVVAVMACGFAVWRRSGSRRNAALVIGGLVGLLVLALGWAGADAEIGRFITETDSAQLRLRAWRIALDIFRDFPVLGSGINTFGTATILYQSDGGAHYIQAHNDYLQLLAEGGLLVAALLAVALIALSRAIGRRFRDDPDPESYWVRVGSVIGLLAIGLQSLVEFSLQMPGNAALFVVLVAMAVYEPAQLRSSK